MPPDPRDAALIETAASVLAGLVVAELRADHPAIMAEIGKLLNAVTGYNRARAERASDEPLRRAIARL